MDSLFRTPNLIRQMLMFLVIYKFIYVIEENRTTRWLQYCLNDYQQCPPCFPSMQSISNALDTCCNTIFDDIELHTTIDNTINALFGSRNLQYGQMNGEQVVVKYPPNMDKLDHLKTELCATIRNDHERFASAKGNCDLFELRKYGEVMNDALETVLTSNKRYDGLQLCPTGAARNFARTFKSPSLTVAAFWILSYISPDIILFDALSNAVNNTLSNFVPKLHRSCGFTAIVANKGVNLYNFYDRSFRDRLHLAKQMLEAAFAFTYGYDGLRIYLTDATPDNIVVDEQTLNISYIDLDNVLIVDSMAYDQMNGQSKPSTWNQIYKHETIECDDCFSYIPDELCAHHLSDINLFATCQVFTKDAHSHGQNGLLHSIPADVLDEFPDLPDVLSYCVKCPYENCRNRFDVAKELLTVFEIILKAVQQDK